MSSCKKIEPLLSSYYDDELEKQQHLAVAEHLKSCPHCRKQLAEIEAVSKAFGALDTLEVTDEFQDSLHLALVDAARVHRMQSKKDKDSWYYRMPRWLRDWRTYSAAAACLVIAVVFGTGAFQDYSAPTPAIPVATSSPSPQVQIGGAAATEVPAPQQDESGIEIETEEKTQVQSRPQIPYPTALPDLSGEKTGDDRSEVSTTTRPSVSESERPTNPPVPETQPEVQPSQPNVGDDIAPQETDTVVPTQEPDIQNPGSGENEASPTTEPGNAGSSGEEIRATMYGVGKTTIYFQAADAQELAAAAELAREYGEVSASDTSITIKVPNENYAPLLRALYTQQLITQTGSNHEPVAETDPAVSEATDYVYIVVSI